MSEQTTEVVQVVLNRLVAEAEFLLFLADQDGLATDDDLAATAAEIVADLQEHVELHLSGPVSCAHVIYQLYAAFWVWAEETLRPLQHVVPQPSEAHSDLNDQLNPLT